MEEILICPVCGKKWGSITDLSTCVNNHAKKEKEDNKKIKEEEIQKVRNAIEQKYKELKVLIDKFNTLNKNSFCHSELSFKQNSKEIDDLQTRDLTDFAKFFNSIFNI